MTTEPMLAGDSKVDVQVKKSSRKHSYKTKLAFTDVNRAHATITSVEPPSITQVGMLQFLLEDRLVSYPLINIFRMETEQLDVIEPSKLIIK